MVADVHRGTRSLRRPVDDSDTRRIRLSPGDQRRIPDPGLAPAGMSVDVLAFLAFWLSVLRGPFGILRHRLVDLHPSVGGFARGVVHSSFGVRGSTTTPTGYRQPSRRRRYHRRRPAADRRGRRRRQGDEDGRRRRSCGTNRQMSRRRVRRDAGDEAMTGSFDRSKVSRCRPFLPIRAKPSRSAQFDMRIAAVGVAACEPSGRAAHGASRGAVIVDSIFIASMVPIGSPAATCHRR